jgi:hypothetical protein|tara:strand:+ start:466 stop:1149 length:684 start_codon:yes stop_codon:yes gene_type:complete
MKDKPNYYAVLIAEVRYDHDLGNFSKLLYAEISALCNKEGYCWASNNYFAALYEVKELTVTRAITQLVERGYLIRELNNVGGQDTKRILRLSISEMISPVIKNDRELGIKNDTHNTINLDNIKTNKSITIKLGFDIFWKGLKGRKLNKPDAKRAYERIGTKLCPEDLVKRFNNLFISREEKFIPYPAKWLRNEGWNDETSIEKVNGDIVFRNKEGYIVSEDEYNQSR